MCKSSPATPLPGLATIAPSMSRWGSPAPRSRRAAARPSRVAARQLEEPFEFPHARGRRAPQIHWENLPRRLKPQAIAGLPASVGLDESVAGGLAQPPWDALLPLAGALALLGSSQAWWGFVALLVALRRWRVGVPLALALLLADLAAAGLKEIVARPRPEDAVFAETGFAFPSGHAARAAAAAGLAWALGLGGWRLAAFAFALLVGFARLVARAHWLSDVLAGLALGAALGGLAALAWRRDAFRLRSRAIALAERLARVAPPRRAARAPEEPR